MSFVVSPSLSKPFLCALARAIAARDLTTWQHADRVRRYATALAAQAGIDDESLVLAIDAAALLHDVGKLAIPDELLDKPGPLTSDEYDRVKQHAAIGADLLAEVAFPGPLAALVRHHHENWDGSGYPDRQAGDEIPLGARVLAIADCYDALTSHRPYRRALNRDSAIAMIRERRGSMFDPGLTDSFLQVVWRLRAAPPVVDRRARIRPPAGRSLVLVEAAAR
ncbi:MAG TPA: HD-GYP domain-containing protein [Vicinamibacterales bacterium]|nr:HD-GYP domain-containing protein [Vicinamibacterales bacterium]